MILKLRVILDIEEDVFRDIELDREDHMLDLHQAIVNAFEFDGSQLASFYKSDDDWNQGDEIPLESMDNNTAPMEEVPLTDCFNDEEKRMIYVYDFLDMWTFLVELVEVKEPDITETYPALTLVYGQRPEQAPDKQFEGETRQSDDIFDGDDSFDQFDYETIDLRSQESGMR
jgi:hypothetical protein